MQALHSIEAREQATAPKFPPLAHETRPAVDTAAAAYYLSRRPQTLREPLHNLFFCFPHPIKSTSYKREFVGNWGYAEVP